MLLAAARLLLALALIVDLLHLLQLFEITQGDWNGKDLFCD